MSAGSYDFDIEQNATFERTFTWEVDGDPVDLTGFDALLHIRTRADKSVILYTAAMGDGIELTATPTDGTLVLIIPAADTLAMNFTRAKYDLLLTDGDGNQTRLIQGDVNISKAVTREEA